MALRRAAVALAATVALLAAAVPVYRAVALNRMHEAVVTTPREPESGVVLGAGALTLDPPAGAARPTRAVLLLHGFVGSPLDFGALPGRLAAAGFHVRAPLLPGHGTTPAALAAVDADALLDAARGAFAELRATYGEVHVVGFSMGGALATLLAAETEAERVVLVAPYFRVRHRWWYGLPAERWNALLGGVVPWAIKGDAWVQVNRVEGRGDFYSYDVIPTAGAAALMELGRRAGDPALLAAVDEPVLLLHADGDMAADPAAALAAWRRMDGGEGAAILFGTRSNHHLLHDHDRAAALDAVVAWLTEGRVPQAEGARAVLLPGG